MNRRNFLVGSGVTLAAFALSPEFVFSAPRIILYGDGKHDDTAALQAWCDGKDVYRLNGERLNQALSNGEFVVSDTIYVRGQRSTITNCEFHCDKMDNRAVTDVQSAADCHISNVTIASHRVGPFAFLS